MQKENGVRAEVSEETLIALYPEDSTRRALVRIVDLYERQHRIDVGHAAAVLLLGEHTPEGQPDVYSELIHVRDNMPSPLELERLVEPAEATA